ncbi:sugar phosphate isomerase/epimerase family protein [Bremerella cremea]|nr:sugar phosphate isomerase/epimerase [Bremerella cremea]
MFVSASTECFPDLPLRDCMEKLVDLEFSAVDMTLDENGDHLRPSDVCNNLQHAIDICHDTQRLVISNFRLLSNAQGDDRYREYEEICRLAKAVKVASITIPSGPFGTPFNEEVEHLREMVAISAKEGIVTSMHTHVGCLSQDCDTIQVLCDNVKGLGITLDPSHFICREDGPKSYDKVLKYVSHVYLRDTRQDAMHVRVGQGEVEYGRLITQLEQSGYNRALTVHMPPLPDTDQMAEMRKIRLLLESLL